MYKLLNYIQSSDFIHQCPFIVFTDSDVYINMINLKKALELESPNNKKLYSGLHFTTKKFGSFAHGSLILFSRTALKSVNVSKCEQSRSERNIPVFDVELGACVKLQHLPYVNYRGHWITVINNKNVFEKYSTSSALEVSCAIVFHKIVNVDLTYQIHKEVLALNVCEPESQAS